jgi:hypothetical protein
MYSPFSLLPPTRVLHVVEILTILHNPADDLQEVGWGWEKTLARGILDTHCLGNSWNLPNRHPFAFVA